MRVGERCYVLLRFDMNRVDGEKLREAAALLQQAGVDFDMCEGAQVHEWYFDHTASAVVRCEFMGTWHKLQSKKIPHLDEMLALGYSDDPGPRGARGYSGRRFDEEWQSPSLVAAAWWAMRQRLREGVLVCCGSLWGTRIPICRKIARWIGRKVFLGLL